MPSSMLHECTTRAVGSPLLWRRCPVAVGVAAAAPQTAPAIAAIAAFVAPTSSPIRRCSRLCRHA